MRKVRFTEEQMVAIMREADREPVAVVAEAAWDQRTDDLRLAQAVRRIAIERRAAAEATRGRECAAEEAGGRA